MSSSESDEDAIFRSGGRRFAARFVQGGMADVSVMKLVE
jgi:hypothetical protein